MTYINVKKLVRDLEMGDAQAVEMSRSDARDLIDELCPNDENDDLITALDEAQGRAEKATAYIVIKVNVGDI